MKVIDIGGNVWDKYIHLKTMFPGGQVASRGGGVCCEDLPGTGRL